ncbi:MAG: glycosyltransferase family 4 protein [Desulfomonilaceae bacterium]
MHATIFDGTNTANAQSWFNLTFRVSSFIQKQFNTVQREYSRCGFKHAAFRLLRIPVDLGIRPLERMILSHVTIQRTVKCYPLSQDVYDILVNFFNWPVEKLEICPLGVDTELFEPPTNDNHLRQRHELRERLGFLDQDIVCIYTGRFTEGKDPLCLALAIDELVKKGLPFRGLFVGNGDDEYLERLRECHGCVIHPFVSVAELPAFYRAADIGVWPKQESTSQLDAMSCGLPLVLSDLVKAAERVDGNAATFREGDVHSLALAIKSLLTLEKRKRMGTIGAERVRKRLSWDSIAASRIEDYRQSVLGQSA